MTGIGFATACRWCMRPVVSHEILIRHVMFSLLNAFNFIGSLVTAFLFLVLTPLAAGAVEMKNHRS